MNVLLFFTILFHLGITAQASHYVDTNVRMVGDPCEFGLQCRNLAFTTCASDFFNTTWVTNVCRCKFGYVLDRPSVGCKPIRACPIWADTESDNDAYIVRNRKLINQKQDSACGKFQYCKFGACLCGNGTVFDKDGNCTFVSDSENYIHKNEVSKFVHYQVLQETKDKDGSIDIVKPPVVVVQVPYHNDKYLNQVVPNIYPSFSFNNTLLTHFDSQILRPIYFMFAIMLVFFIISVIANLLKSRRFTKSRKNRRDTSRDLPEPEDESPC